MMAREIPAAIRKERARQVGAEGFDPAHDDAHADGALLTVATLYWQHAIGVPVPTREVIRHFNRRPPIRNGRTPAAATWSVRVTQRRRVPAAFPWDAHWWKPKSPRRDLVRAGALCLAEIERRQRAGSFIGHVEQKLEWIIDALAETRP